MPIFIIIDNFVIINRVTANTIDDIALSAGQEAHEAIDPWDGYIGQAVTVDGVVPDQDPSPEPPPDRCSMRQARLALLAAGHLQNVIDAIALESTQAQIEWEYGTVVMRSHPLVQTILPALGLTETDIDNLFISAVTY